MFDMRRTWIGVIAVCLLVAAGIEAAQRGWVIAFKPGIWSTSSAQTRFLTVRPAATIGADANGLYCTPLTENAVGTHDLGALPAGIRVSVIVEGIGPPEFNPVAAVIAVMLGEKAANTVKASTFYDNDSGGDNDPRIEFTTPHAGNYFLLVGDHTDAHAGCYRYQMIVS